MRERHIRFNEHYDFTDRIMDLNFYGYFIDKFKIMIEETTTAGGRTLKQLLAEFVWQDDAVDYVRGKRPYPGGMDWIGAKRILAVMNSGKKHFVTLEILLNEGVSNVYDCNIVLMKRYYTYVGLSFQLTQEMFNSWKRRQKSQHYRKEVRQQKGCLIA